MQGIITLILAIILINCSTQEGSTNSQAFRIQADTTTIYFNSTENLKSNFIPDSVFSMTNLKHLHIQGMDCDYGDNKNCWAIIEISQKIKNLKKLESLSLPVNAIGKFPEEMTELTNLKSLNLTDNLGLQDINFVTKLLNLEELSIFGCYLNKLPADIEKLKRLRYLGLTGNHIEKIEIDRIKNKLPNCQIIFQ